MACISWTISAEPASVWNYVQSTKVCAPSILATSVKRAPDLRAASGATRRIGDPSCESPRLVTESFDVEPQIFFK